MSTRGSPVLGDPTKPSPQSRKQQWYKTIGTKIRSLKEKASPEAGSSARASTVSHDVSPPSAPTTLPRRSRLGNIFSSSGSQPDVPPDQKNFSKQYSRKIPARKDLPRRHSFGNLLRGNGTPRDIESSQKDVSIQCSLVTSASTDRRQLWETRSAGSIWAEDPIPKVKKQKLRVVSQDSADWNIKSKATDETGPVPCYASSLPDSLTSATGQYEPANWPEPRPEKTMMSVPKQPGDQPNAQLLTGDAATRERRLDIENDNTTELLATAYGKHTVEIEKQVSVMFPGIGEKKGHEEIYANEWSAVLELYRLRNLYSDHAFFEPRDSTFFALVRDRQGSYESKYKTGKPELIHLGSRLKSLIIAHIDRSKGSIPPNPQPETENAHTTIPRATVAVGKKPVSDFGTTVTKLELVTASPTSSAKRAVPVFDGDEEGSDPADDDPKAGNSATGYEHPYVLPDENYIADCKEGSSTK